MVDQPAAAPNAGPFMSCSDCRAQMRDRYFSLNERPICIKCRPTYVQRIKRTDGPGATWRVGFQGALVAVAGILALIVVSMIWPSARILLLVPIGYFIGKRMMGSLGGYSARRYQYLAVALTYVCFLVAFTVSAVNEEQASRTRRAEVRAKMQGTMATQDDALREELATLNAMYADPADTLSAGDSPSEEPAATQTKPAEEDTEPGPGRAIALLLFSPVISMLQLGLTFAAIGLMAMIYALYQAWKQTNAQGMALDLRGPYRVGQGPIPAR